MKKKLSKVLAIVLSLVMVAGLATIDASTAQAAKKKKATKLSIVSTGKKNVKSGQKRTIKIKGTNAKKAKWSVSGTGKSYIKLAKKTGKTVSFTVEANATGKAKITAKLTKKNKVSVTYKLSCDATAIALEGADVYLGDTANLALSVTPSNAKLTVEPAYEVFSDETAATVSEDAKVTPGAMGCEFYTAKAGTYYVKATAGEMTSIAKVTATERVAKLETAQQTKANELVVTFDYDASKVVDNVADIIIKNGSQVVMPVKKATLDKDDNKKVTLETFSNMTDGKMNTISYKESTPLEFQASDGIVASLAISPSEIPVSVAVQVKAQTVDANKVILDEFNYGKQDVNKFDFEITGDGDVDNDGKLTFNEISNKATATLVYRTGKYLANGEPETQKVEQVITAIAPGNIVGTEKYVFVKASNTDTVAELTYKQAVEDKSGKKDIREVKDGSVYHLYALVEDSLGYTRVDGTLSGKFELKTSNEDILTVDGDVITAVSEGRASVLVCDKENPEKVEFSLGVKVEGAPKLTSVKLSKTSATLTTGDVSDPNATNAQAAKGDSTTFEITAYDQYNEKYEGVKLEYSAVNDMDAFVNNTSNNKDNLTVAVKDGCVTTSINDDGKVVVTAGSIKTRKEYMEANGNDMTGKVEGRDYLDLGKSATITYAIKVSDELNDGIKPLEQKVYVSLKRPSANISKLNLVVDTTGGKDNQTLKNTGALDTALKDKDANANKNMKIKLGVYDGNGTLVTYTRIPSGATIDAGKKDLVTDTSINANTTATTPFKVDTNTEVTKGSFVAHVNTGVGAKSGIDNTSLIYFIGSKSKTLSDVSGSAFGGTYSGPFADKYMIDRADNGSYAIKVKGVKINTADKTVTAAGTDAYTATVTVKNSQKTDFTVQNNDRKAGGSTAPEVAARAFRIEKGDAEAYTYNADDADNLPQYIFSVPDINGKSGNKDSGEGVYSFRKLEIYVPYRTGEARNSVIYDKIVKYLSVTVNQGN